MLVCPDSSLCLKKYPRNIKHIPVVFFQICLDFKQNCYSRTTLLVTIIFFSVPKTMDTILRIKYYR